MWICVTTFFVKQMQRQDSSREATTKQSPSGPNTRIASNKRTSQGTDQQIKHNTNKFKSGQPDTQLKGKEEVSKCNKFQF